METLHRYGCGHRSLGIAIRPPHILLPTSVLVPLCTAENLSHLSLPFAPFVFTLKALLCSQLAPVLPCISSSGLPGGPRRDFFMTKDATVASAGCQFLVADHAIPGQSSIHASMTASQYVHPMVKLPRSPSQNSQYSLTGSRKHIV